MLKRLEIHNLKSIGHLDMECKELNLLTGTNSSGKSTALQALLFLSQNSEKQTGLNGDLIRIGEYEDARCIYLGEDEIRIGITDDEGHQMYRSVTSRGRSMEQIDENESDGLRYSLNYMERGLQYLSCNRLGPSETYPKDLSFAETIGINGEYAMAYLNKNAQEPLEEELCRDKQNYTFLSQINWWLRYIANAEVHTEEIPGANLILASYQMGDIQRIRPGNIGAGISYLISVLIVCLSAKTGTTIIIENPEIHLHPKAQGRVCEFLYFIATKGRQIFVESHSDHIFNGFRAGIATNEMEAEKIAIDFFYLNEDHMTSMERIKVEKYGRIANQKEDLFDQFDLDLNRMLRL